MMSKIRELIEQELLEMGIHDDVMCREAIAISIESTIKAEIMGESRGEFAPEIGSWMKQSDLENLFKESE